MDRFVFRLLIRLQAGLVLPVGVRRLFLRACGISLGPRASVYEGVFISSPLVRIGARAGIYVNCHLDGAAPLTIGEDAVLGANVLIVTGSHPIGPATKRCDRAAKINSPVVVGNGAWIGAGAIILPGVTVGAGCVIAAGSVVHKDTRPNGLYGGNPARLVRMLPTGGEASTVVEPTSPVAPRVVSA